MDADDAASKMAAEAVSRNVRALRQLRGLTQADLAALVGLNQSLITRIENGKREVSVGEAWALAASLGVPVSDLFTATSTYYDGLLIARVRAPLREVMMRVAEVERLSSEEDPAGIGSLVRRVAEGVAGYLSEVPSPYENTADHIAVSMNLSLALVVLRELPGMKARMVEALRTFEEARSQRQPLERVEDLRELRELAAALSGESQPS